MKEMTYTSMHLFHKTNLHEYCDTHYITYDPVFSWWKPTVHVSLIWSDKSLTELKISLFTFGLFPFAYLECEWF